MPRYAFSGRSGTRKITPPFSKTVIRIPGRSRSRSRAPRGRTSWYLLGRDGEIRDQIDHHDGCRPVGQRSKDRVDVAGIGPEAPLARDVVGADRERDQIGPELEGLRQLPAQPHALRHACGAELLRRTKNLRVVQEQLRHVDVQTTTGYTRLTQQGVRQALETLDDEGE